VTTAVPAAAAPADAALLQLIASAGAVLLQREIPESANLQVAMVCIIHLTDSQPYINMG
jgi:hypothetical protein